MRLLPQTGDGFALAAVLLVIVVLSLTAVPLLDMVTRNREMRPIFRSSHICKLKRAKIWSSAYIRSSCQMAFRRTMQLADCLKQRQLQIFARAALTL